VSSQALAAGSCKGVAGVDAFCMKSHAPPDAGEVSSYRPKRPVGAAIALIVSLVVLVAVMLRIGSDLRERSDWNQALAGVQVPGDVVDNDDVVVRGKPSISSPPLPHQPPATSYHPEPAEPRNTPRLQLRGLAQKLKKGVQLFGVAGLDKLAGTEHRPRTASFLIGIRFGPRERLT
jgi:hypothetical protein